MYCRDIVFSQKQLQKRIELPYRLGPKKKQKVENALNALSSTMEDHFRQNMWVAA
jgi:hypothetical protein